jgi:tryptophan synthase alpha chain
VVTKTCLLLLRHLDLMLMNKLDQLPSKKILSLFMTCGFPTLSQSKKVFDEILSHQPDIIEFGLPFSDPMADGPIIQESSKIALKSKITTKQSLNLISQLKKKSEKTAFVIMCYLNTVQKYGVQKFIKEIRNIVDGIIIVDLPFEEEKPIKNLLDKNDIHLIKLISPMTDQQRSKRLLKEAKGFVYYISATGITGSNKLDYKEINKNVLALKKQTKIPVLVGFGIKSKKDVLAISKNTKADGVIIGSALIQKYFDLKMNFTKYIISLRKFIKEVKI